MNRIDIIGNLCADPEMRTTATTGKTVTNFTVAVSRRGDKDKTDYFRIAAWGALGESCGKYLGKGSKVFVTGEASARAYEAKDGALRASIEIYAREVEFLSNRSQSRTDAFNAMPDSAPAKAETYAPVENAQFVEITDSDLPF